MRRVSLKLSGMNDEIAADESLLALRENVLNEHMMESPEGIAQRVYQELVSRVREEAPSLLMRVMINE